MANKKISELLEASTLNDNDYLMIVQSGSNKKIKAEKFKSSSNNSSVDFDSLTEVNTAKDDSYLIINQDGMNKKVKINKVKGSSNLTNEYVELTGDDGKLYRMVVKDGKPHVYPSEVDTSQPAVSGDQLNFDGLIINKMFGGGTELKDTACSHSFIELYNLGTNPSNTKDINLNGVYLWVKFKDGAWQSLKLKGIIPANHSFLIRCGFHNDPHKSVVRCNVDKYDMEWDIKLPEKGLTALLYIGSEEPEANPVRYNRDAATNAITWTNPRYIDMFAAGGKGESENPPVCEVRYIKCMDRYTGVMREDFANSGGVNVGSNKSIKGNNEADALPIPYNTCDINAYRPRCVEDGEWGIYVDKPQLKSTCPNLINICYGQNGNNTRTFTWQSMVTEEGYLKYRKLGETDWNIIESSKQIISHVDSDATVHRVIITDLEFGTYEYMAGEEGAWSDIYLFEVKEYNQSNPIKILMTSDEQAWTKNEYKATGTAAKFIQNNEKFDFHLNTGDISQNANRSFEWRYYFNYYSSNKNICHMTTCGNNDLIDKKYSDAFQYYTTYENQKWNSVYHWDLGFTHFVCLNSNTDMTYVDGSIGGFSSTEEFLQTQADWLDEHLTEVNSRTENKPRWVVCYMHLSPFTVVREKRLQRFIKVFEKHKVDLVLCGHNHAYSRSIPLYTGFDWSIHPEYSTYTKQSGSQEITVVENELAGDGNEINRTPDIANGTYYLMCQATGYKLSGKEKPISLPQQYQGTKHANSANQPWWYAEGRLTTQPSYIMLEIGYDSITAKAYTVEGVLTKDTNLNVIVNDYIPTGKENAQTKREFDSLTINYSDRNK